MKVAVRNIQETEKLTNLTLEKKIQMLETVEFEHLKKSL